MRRLDLGRPTLSLLPRPLSNIWADGANWRLGHWLTGRLGAVSLTALVRALCTRAGLSAARIDVSGLWGAVEGYVISALESPRTSIDVLARHFGFDAVESEGKIRFVMRGRAPVLSITPDGMVEGGEGKGEPLEIVRAQESELPQALKWTIARADEDYDAAIVEARRITVDSTRIAAEAFAIAVPPEEAERRCRRALVEAWVGRETATFRLPPSKLALDPCDVVGLVIDGRTLQMRIVQTADADARPDRRHPQSDADHEGHRPQRLCRESLPGLPRRGLDLGPPTTPRHSLTHPKPTAKCRRDGALAPRKETSMLSTIDGYKTYLVMAALLLVVLLEKGLGLDVPGVALGEDWMLVVMNAIGLGTLRHGIQKSGL